MSKVIIPDDVAEAIFTINNFCTTQSSCEECFLYDNSREYFKQTTERCRNNLPKNDEIYREKVEVYVYERNE